MLILKWEKQIRIVKIDKSLYTVTTFQTVTSKCKSSETSTQQTTRYSRLTCKSTLDASQNPERMNTHLHPGKSNSILHFPWNKKTPLCCCLFYPIQATIHLPNSIPKGKTSHDAPLLSDLEWSHQCAVCIQTDSNIHRAPRIPRAGRSAAILLGEQVSYALGRG